MKTLIIATTAILTLGCGSAFAGAPAAQGPVQLAQQQERPAIETPANENRLYPVPQGGLLAQQQERPASETPAYENQLYPVPQGGAAIQHGQPLGEHMSPHEDGGAAAVAPESPSDSQK